MHRHAVLAGAALIAGVGAAPGSAQSIDSPLARHAARAEEREAVLAAARAQGQGASCQEMRFSIVEPPRPYRAQRFEGDRLVEGMWIQAVHAEGCASVGRLTILNVVAPGQTVRRVSLLPGRTIADPQLQRDGVRYASIASGAEVRDCDVRRHQVVNTRFEGPANKGAPSQERAPWTEVWQVQACATTVMVRMRFIPDDTGTTISATPDAPRR